MIIALITAAVIGIVLIILFLKLMAKIEEFENDIYEEERRKRNEKDS